MGACFPPSDDVTADFIWEAIKREGVPESCDLQLATDSNEVSIQEKPQLA